VRAVPGPKTQLTPLSPGSFSALGRLSTPTPTSRASAPRQRSTCGAVASLDEVASGSRRGGRVGPRRRWILGNIFAPVALARGGEFADASVLDRVAPTRPVCLLRSTARRLGELRGDADVREGDEGLQLRPRPVRSSATGTATRRAFVIDGAMASSGRRPRMLPRPTRPQILRRQAEVLRWGSPASTTRCAPQAGDRVVQTPTASGSSSSASTDASPPAGGEGGVFNRRCRSRGRGIGSRSGRSAVHGRRDVSAGARSLRARQRRPEEHRTDAIDPKTSEATTIACAESRWAG